MGRFGVYAGGLSILCHRFGSTTVAKVSSPNELRQLLVDPCFESETVVIKPNWVSTEPGGFTDSRTLRMFLEAFDSRVVVTECLHIGRSMNLLKDGMSFTVGGKEVNWRWLLKGEGWNWLVENPDWGWFRKGGHWEQIRKEDKAFLDEYGFSDLFKEFDVDYVNVTEEVWSGRSADSVEVKRLVEARFAPVQVERLYSMVPKKLFDLRGSTLISLARLKNYASFCLKNLFGLIADPLRPWWHGPKNSRIARSIVDVNKLYRALFNVYGVCEALNSLAVPHAEGRFEAIYVGRYNVVEGLGLVAFGRDLVSLDAILLNLCDHLMLQETNRMALEVAEQEFGAYDRDVVKEAKVKVGNWIPR